MEDGVHECLGVGRTARHVGEAEDGAPAHAFLLVRFEAKVEAAELARPFTVAAEVCRPYLVGRL